MKRSHARSGLVALTALGLAVALLRAQPAAASFAQLTTTMKQFVIIFRQSPRTFTPEDLARRQQEVSEWARAQNAAGHKLEPRILAPEIDRPGAADNGVGAGAWPITALLFLEAADLSAASGVAASHPARNYGVSVEVRPWAPPAVPATPSATR